MREYIHFFEDSDLRDAYEHGSDYTEPYVSYTPIINEYKVQFNGRTIDDFAVTKQGNSYLISSNSNSIEIINEEEFEEPPIVNSNVFYISNVSVIDNGTKKTPNVSVIDNGTKKTRAHMYVFPEDLELTEESTEFTFNGNTYYLVYDTLYNNKWHVYRDSEHTKGNGTIVKIDIVSVPSSSNDFVHYNLTDDTYNGHEYVDLGLPSGTKWAKMNVGATSETDAGLYFAWGETQGYTASQVSGSATPHKDFSWSDYKYGTSSSNLTKYNATDNKTHLELTDDAAAANMGGDWHMPNRAQCIELFKETTNGFVTSGGAFTQYAWSDTDGSSSPTSTTTNITWSTAGYFFFKNSYASVTDAISANNYLFIPAAGFCGGGEVSNVGEWGVVWSSSLNTDGVSDAWIFYFGSGGAGVIYGSLRCNGRSVRGVVGQMDEITDETTSA